MKREIESDLKGDDGFLEGIKLDSSPRKAEREHMETKKPMSQARAMNFNLVV